MALYKGFSTYNRYKKFKVNDFELVKQDLFNHFNIRKGEKLMNPNFGTIIWGLIFDPMTVDLQKVIVDDIKRIVGYDPRISADKIEITEFAQGLQIALTVTYLTENKTAKMLVEFNRDTKTASRRDASAR
jgi:phage baseplate assembly protein W